jgi:hypothetical protein
MNLVQSRVALGEQRHVQDAPSERVGLRGDAEPRAALTLEHLATGGGEDHRGCTA